MSVTEIREKIATLTNGERIELAMWLWDSIENKDEAIQSPDWHAEVLAEREAEIQSGNAKSLTLDELKERFRC